LLWVGWVILLKTVRVVLAGRGAMQLAPPRAKTRIDAAQFAH